MISQAWRQSKALQFKPLQVAWAQIVYDVTKEGADEWGRLEIGGMTSKYDGLLLAIPL